jgi:Sporulation delaying protein SdpA
MAAAPWRPPPAAPGRCDPIRLPVNTGVSDEIAALKRGRRFTAAILFTVIAVTTLAQLPHRLTGGLLSGQHAVYAMAWPQHWGFFGDTPDTEVIVAYLVGPTGAAAAEPAQRHLSAPNLWGLSRVSDTEQNEIAYLTSRLPPDQWVHCTADTPAGCRDLDARPYPLVNRFPLARLCGRVAFAILGPSAGPVGRDSPRRRVSAVALAELRCIGGP